MASVIHKCRSKLASCSRPGSVRCLCHTVDRHEPGLEADLPLVCSPSPGALGPAAARGGHGVRDAAEAAVRMEANEPGGTCRQERALCTAPAGSSTSRPGKRQNLAWLASLAELCCLTIPPRGSRTGEGGQLTWSLSPRACSLLGNAACARTTAVQYWAPSQVGTGQHTHRGGHTALQRALRTGQGRAGKDATAAPEATHMAGGRHEPGLPAGVGGQSREAAKREAGLAKPRQVDFSLASIM